jgi:hypothetical protein
MLFYVKRSLPLEIAATLLLAGIRYWGIHRGGLTLNIALSPHAVLFGLGGALWLTLLDFSSATRILNLQRRSLRQQSHSLVSQRIHADLLPQIHGAA